MSNRSFWINRPVFILTLFIVLIAVIKSEKEILDESLTEPAPTQVQQIRSPMLEVLMHLPSNFRDVNSFKNFLGIEPYGSAESSRNGKKDERNSVVDVRTYEIAQPETFDSSEPKKIILSNEKASNLKRVKREDENITLEKPEPQQLVSSLTEAEYGEKYTNSQGTKPDAVRGPTYTTYTVKGIDLADADHPKRRRDDSVDGREDNSQRDKRTFSEGANSSGGNGESTTALPFWKRKKENPPFITGRGSAPKGNEYTLPQHRSSDSARESHSLKSHENPGQGNEIGRSNQDSYFSATNRRTYSRQSDPLFSSTPKSVYDMLDYGQNKKHQEMGRMGQERHHHHHPDGKDVLRDGRLTHEQYTSHRLFPNDRPMYGRPRYQPPPYPAEIIGRGTEYYHRTVEPISGRIIYYADMPEIGRSFDYRNSDSINRNYNPNGFHHGGYSRNFVSPHDGRFSPSFNRPMMNHARGGRSNFQAFGQPHQDRDRYQRDPRFVGGFEKENHFPGDVRNKTYIIYDADDVRFHHGKNRFSPDVANRFGYPSYQTGYNNYHQPPQEPFRRFPVFPPGEYFSQSGFPFRNRFRPIDPYWDFNLRGPQPEGRWLTNGNPPPPPPSPSLKPFNSPEVQIPLSTANRNFDSSRDFDKNKKA